MTNELISQKLRFEQDVVHARQRARELAQLLGFDQSEQIRLATATSEIARNAFRYARNGNVHFRVEADAPPRLVVVVSDSGPGIKNLEDIFQGRYQSATGLGKGIIGTKRLMDSFDVQTGPSGTTITFSKLLPKYAPALTRARLDDVARRLQQRAPESPYEELDRQNQELLRTLAELRVRQEELAQLNRELEDTNRGVVALYAELDQRADALRNMSDAKTTFLSNMSHEFRTPLNSILSLSQMLLQRLDGDLTAEQEKQVSYIRSSAHGLQEMVNDLLDIAKVEAGKVDVKPKHFSVDELFGALRGMLKPILQSASVALVFEDPVGLPPLFTDEAKLSQILRNFISNALKFTDRGEVRISAKTGESGMIVFSIADTGIGIAPEDQKRVFQEFEQVQNTMQRNVKGTGLGLPLAKQFAHLLGGSVSLESEVGVGSTFSVTIPAVYPGADAEEGVELPVPQPGRIPILIVEDNRETAFLMERYFDNTEFQVVSVHSIALGRDVFTRFHPEIVVLDVLIDGESSWDLLHHIRSLRPEVPIVTVSVMGSERGKASAMGASLFLEKPVSRDLLLRSLRPLVHRRSPSKLLLIDDSEISRYALREALSASNVSILEARGGREGLRMASEERPDAIFLDLKMPDMTGFEVLEELRASSEARSIPVIIHSSQELTEGDVARLRSANAVFLSKQETSGPDGMHQIQTALKTLGLRTQAPGHQHA